jgi:phage major head subunit gpT-like protein
MDGVISAQYLNALFLGFNMKFQTMLEKTPTFWETFADEVPSTTASQAYPWIDVLGDMRIWDGPREVLPLVVRSQIIENQTFEKTYAIKRTDIEDDQFAIYSSGVRMLAKSAKQWPDWLVQSALSQGTTIVGYDNQPIFNNAHPLDPSNPTSATQSNLFNSSTGTPSPLSAPAVAFGIQVQALMAAADGIPLDIISSHLIVPAALKWQAETIVNTALIAQAVAAAGASPGGAAAGSNVLQGALRPQVFPRLDATDNQSWYLICNTGDVKPIIYQRRIAPTFFYRIGEGDTPVFERDEYPYGARARGMFGYGQYQLILKFGQ